MWRLCAKLNRTKKLDEDLMETPLKRCLNTFDITLLGVGHMIGAGIYVLAGNVAKTVAGPGIVLSFIVAGIASLLAALCYAEFGARVPKAGSAYVYTYVTIGEFWAFVIGWNIILEHMIGSAAVARAWSGYLDSLFGGSIKNGTIETVGTIHVEFFGGYPDFVACLLCLVLGCVLAIGVKSSTHINSAFTVVNMAVVTFVICFGLYWAKGANWVDYGGFLPFGFSGVLAGAATCFYAFVGFDSIATSGEEAKDPAWSIPVATCVSMVIVTITYVGVSLALTLMVPYIDINPDSALPDAFAHNGAAWAKYIVAIGALCGMTTTLFGGLFALPRCVYAMAGDGLFFEIFARVHGGTQTPVVNLVVCSFLTGLIALLFDIGKLVEFMSIGTLMAYTIVSSSVIILRYQPARKYRKGFEGLEGSTKDEYQPILTEADFAGTLKARWTFLESIFDFEPGSLVTTAVLLMTIFISSFWGVVHLAAEDIQSYSWWAILLMLFFIGFSVLCFVVICFHQQNKTKLSFKVPWVPLLPTLSIFLNISLMTHLHWLTWVRFVIWMFIGLLVYFLYGMKHSVQGSTSLVLSKSFGALQEESLDQQHTTGEAEDNKPILDDVDQ